MVKKMFNRRIFKFLFSFNLLFVIVSVLNKAEASTIIDGRVSNHIRISGSDGNVNISTKKIILKDTKDPGSEFFTLAKAENLSIDVDEISLENCKSMIVANKLSMNIKSLVMDENSELIFRNSSASRTVEENDETSEVVFGNHNNDNTRIESGVIILGNGLGQEFSRMITDGLVENFGFIEIVE